MVLPSKVYEALKFIVKLIPLLVTFLGTVLLVVGISEQSVNVVLVILGAIGTLIEGIVEVCKANHWKIQADEAVVDISDYEKQLVGEAGEKQDSNGQPSGFADSSTLTTTISPDKE